MAFPYIFNQFLVGTSTINLVLNVFSLTNILLKCHWPDLWESSFLLWSFNLISSNLYIWDASLYIPNVITWISYRKTMNSDHVACWKQSFWDIWRVKCRIQNILLRFSATWVNSFMIEPRLNMQIVGVKRAVSIDSLAFLLFSTVNISSFHSISFSLIQCENSGVMTFRWPSSANQ